MDWKFFLQLVDVAGLPGYDCVMREVLDFSIICATFSSSWTVWPSKTYLGFTIFRNVGNHMKQPHVPEDMSPYFLLLNKLDIVLVTLFPYRITIVSNLNTTMCFGYCWATYHCQLYRSIEWWTKMLLCWIYVAGSNKRYLCHHVQCPILLSDFYQIWKFLDIFIKVPSIKFHGCPSIWATLMHTNRRTWDEGNRRLRDYANAPEDGK